MNINYKNIIIFIIIIYFVLKLNTKYILIILILLFVFLYIFYKNDKKSNVCRKSTINNPFGNLLLYSQFDKYENDLCPNQHQNIDKNIRFNIYNDSNDIYLKKNIIRYFRQMPSQIHPNNINNFTKYLFNFNNKICKSDNNCLVNDDLRYHK